MPLALRKGIDLGVDFVEDSKLYLEGSEVLLRELTTNLVDNAIKYTAAGGQVTVALWHAWHEWPEGEDERLILSVTDNGPGIAAAERGKVFQRFYRVLGNAAEGSGLGLAIVREVAELHGGEVTLHEPPQNGGGAVGLQVRVVFPVKRAAVLARLERQSPG